MTIRAILMGLALGLFVSAFTHLNDVFIQGSWFISNHLPIGVLGVLVVLILALNPLLRAITPRWTMKGPELAVIVALGLAACGWPSFSYFRTFITITAMPNHWQGPKADWHAAGVMRYLPGGDPLLASGHVQDWDALVQALAEPERRQGEPVVDRLWDRFGAREREWIESHRGQSLPIDDRSRLLRVINQALASGDLMPQPPPDVESLPAPMRELLQAHRDDRLGRRERTRLNRWWVTVAFREAVLPPPSGEGVLLAGGREDTPALEGVRSGSGPSRALHELPWATWWPTLRLWGAVGLLLALASLCLTLIVHPQWSRRELLPYPIARFVNELSVREETAWLPTITRQRLFWIGLGAMVLIHGLNGLNVWFPDVPTISVRFSFMPLKELFPNFARVQGTTELFRPYLYFSAIAFCFFLTTPVSFSLGIATFVYGMLGAALLAGGASFQGDYIGADKGNLLRFGAYLAMAGTIVYIGRRYYTDVLTSAFGWKRAGDMPASAVWAMRGLILSFVLAVLVFQTAGLDWLMATLFVGMLLVMFLVMTRIICETGMFFLQPMWLPIGILTGLLGFEAIGPTTYLVLAIASVLLAGDPRTLLMPYLANGLQIVERSGGARPGRVAPWLVVMLLAGFLVSGVALFSLTYNKGLGAAGVWETRMLPTMPLDEAARQIASSEARNTLADATAVQGLDRLAAVQLDWAGLGWLGLGLGLLTATAMARLRLPWWPIHPVLFLVWGTMPASRLAVSFLLGWLIKLAVVKVTGSHGYRQVLPLMVGIIAGELLMGLIWAGVSGTYYAIEGMAPPVYRIYP